MEKKEDSSIKDLVERITTKIGSTSGSLEEKDWIGTISIDVVDSTAKGTRIGDFSVDAVRKKGKREYFHASVKDGEFSYRSINESGSARIGGNYMIDHIDFIREKHGVDLSKYFGDAVTTIKKSTE